MVLPGIIAITQYCCCLVVTNTIIPASSVWPHAERLAARVSLAISYAVLAAMGRPRPTPQRAMPYAVLIKKYKALELKYIALELKLIMKVQACGAHVRLHLRDALKSVAHMMSFMRQKKSIAQANALKELRRLDRLLN